MSLRTDTTLVVVLKRPRLGYGKQRLAETLGSEPALQLAESFLRCALEDAASWPGPVVLSPSQKEDAVWAGRLLGREVRILPQSEGNLGQRLQQIDETLHAENVHSTLYMGTDAPALHPQHFASAARALETTDTVLASAEDGGVVLMGNRRPWPELAALPWSTQQLGESLHRACLAAGLGCVWSQPGFDIDVASDLHRLAVELRHDRRPARQSLSTLLNQLIKASPALSYEEF